MCKLDWLVVADWVETATAAFWRAPDTDPSTINTEVYFMPAALIYEKSGTILRRPRSCSGLFRRRSPEARSTNIR